jgi:hypothetical protein
LFLLRIAFKGKGSKGFRGRIETAEAASEVALRPREPFISNNYLKYFGDYKAMFEMVFEMVFDP